MQHHTGKIGFYCTFIYGFNERSKREQLWNDLKQLKVDEPWMMCGDFNYVMQTDEKLGSQVRKHEIRYMKKCVMECGMQHIKSSGNVFTWNKNNKAMQVSSLNRIEGFLSISGRKLSHLHKLPFSVRVNLITPM